jgi:hypothetical protein
MSTAFDSEGCVGQPPDAIDGHPYGKQSQQERAKPVIEILKRACQILGATRQNHQCGNQDVQHASRREA